VKIQILAETGDYLAHWAIPSCLRHDRLELHSFQIEFLVDAEKMEIAIALQKINILAIPSHTPVNLDIIHTSGR
jgi:hypothetical protein